MYFRPTIWMDSHSKFAIEINAAMFRPIQEYSLCNMKPINFSVCNLVMMATMQIMEFISVNLVPTIVRLVLIRVHIAWAVSLISFSQKIYV